MLQKTTFHLIIISTIIYRSEKLTGIKFLPLPKHLQLDHRLQILLCPFTSLPEKQSIINYSSQGSTYGSITANNLTSIVPEPDNPTSEIKIDVARASATGSAIGTTFEIVGLLNTNPKSEISDPETISAVEAATYGSTFGAIQAGTESLNGDAVLLKQAINKDQQLAHLAVSDLH